ncbi:MAG: CDP-diacylglycerol--serine O-phosphatidyltransferase [candidate division Zixibacteria bacterium]|nr:CDP-diacylglycerol--serine O-phosphatidyltransferase [candidate division Zixibacteria bacterium]
MKHWMRLTLPNLFTLGSLFSGVSAVFYCIDGFNQTTADPARAAWLIIAAALLDAVDGKVARYSKATSRFGIELDSLADVVSFGVAPMVLVYTLKPFEELTWLPCTLFLMCGAIRLARFNVITNRRVSDLGDSQGYQKENFLGLPIPVAAITVCSYVIFCWDRGEELHLAGPFMGMVVLLSFLMISTVSYQTLPTLAFTGFRSVLTMIVWLSGVVAIVVDPQTMTFPIVSGYIFFGIVRWLVHMVRAEEETVVTAEE